MIRRLGFVLAVVALVSGAGLLLRAEPPLEVGTWASIGAAPENRIGAAAVVLPDGRTLIAGGLANGMPTDAVVVFDPADSSFATAGQLLEPRAGHTATLLKDGRVLITGGTVNELLSGDLEIFDPSDGTSTLVATLAELRSGHAAARLGDGKVLIAGGTGTDGVLQTAEIFDPETGAVALTLSPLQSPRAGASATTLIDGRVLIAGGNNGTADVASAEIYNPSTDSFQPTNTNLDVPRSGHTAVLLPHNNSVLIAGGSSNGVLEASADLFLPAQFPDPYSYGMGQFARTGGMAAPRSGAAGGPHVEGYAFIVGGGQSDAEVYRFATIKTDKDDYAPGEPAIITGSGWEANEEVTLLFQEDPAVHEDYLLTVTADGEGNIYHDQWAPEQHDLGVRFYLMATGQQSGRRAQTTFTDATNTNTAIASSSNPSFTNASVTFTATVTNQSGGGAITSGSVQFRLGGTNCGNGTVFNTVPLNSSGQAQASQTFATPGDRTIRACYLGVDLPGGSDDINPSNNVLTQTVGDAFVTVNKVVVGGTGGSDKFNLLIDGTVRKTDATNGEGTGAVAVTAGSHTVAETSGSGGTPLSDYFTTINCGAAGSAPPGNTTFSINVAAGVSAVCTITNTKKGRIIVDKNTSPSGSSQSFSFTTIGTGYSGFSLTHAAAPDNQLLLPGSYSVTETAVGGWNLTSATCVSSIGDTETPASIELDAGETVTCTFTNTAVVNTAPILNAIGNKTVDEQTLLTFTATATDSDIPAQTLTFSLDAGAPAGAAITSGGVFTWTPTEAQGPGDYPVTVRVTDNGSPAMNDFETINIHVNEVNAAPILAAIGNKTVDEQTLLTFTATATDPDLPANALTFTLDAGAPAGAAITAAGVFTWTPTEAQGPGDYSVTIRVTDNASPALNDFETINIHVDEANAAPVLAGISNKTVDEQTLLTFTATATDADLPGQTLTFSLDAGGPAGAAITPAGVFTWTPTEAQGPGTYSVTVRVTDSGVPALNDFETISIEVKEANTAPVLNTIGDQAVDEDTLLTFTATATDSDVPANTLTFTLDAGAPAGAAITTAGVFTWTPTEAEGPGTYSVTVRVTDNGTPALNDFETIDIEVKEANVAPVLALVGNKAVNEQTLLTFTATATDADVPAQTLTFSLDAGAPAGAAITSGGVFTWTPTEAQGPGTYPITVRVTDSFTPGASDFETIDVEVKEVNVAPVLDAIGDQTIDEQAAFTFTATANDADVPANTLTFTLDSGAPAGAAITTAGVFTWTPAEDQGPGDYTVTVRVTDNGSPALNDFETISIHVNEVNVAPVLDPIGNQTVDELVLLTFTATAADADLPANSLTFSLDAGAPAGASITPAGVFTWTPTEAQGPGTYPITVRVTDNGTPALNDFETINVEVKEVNVAPVLAPIGNQTINEQAAFTFTATANDADVPANTLTFTLDSGAPAGAAITTAGVFTWTPAEDQGPGDYTVTVRVTDNGSPALNDFETISIHVNEVNVAPVLDPIGNQTVDELVLLTFTATAADADLPANSLTFSLDAGGPAGASITPAGVFTWTPTEAQGPGNYSVTVRVMDNGTPALNDFETITIHVNEVNVAPVLSAVGNKTVNELTLLTFTATAADADLPPNTLTFSLDSGAPVGAAITAAGVFTWTPTEAQGPGNYSVTVRVTDNGTPALNDFETITIHVDEVNVTPILSAIGNKSVLLGNTLTFGVSATDADIPLNTLAFSLDAGAPAGTSIITNTSASPAAGTFSWTPTLGQTGLSSLTVRVTDNGAPPLNASETIQVLVKYGVCLQYDPAKSHKKGSTIPVKITLCDASGNNVSSESIVVQATTINKQDNLASPFVADDSGSANPDNNFRYAGGFYIYNLSLKSPGFGTGTWRMAFTVNGVSDPSYLLLFDVR